jgi:arabinofuranosyltransferase
LPVLIGLGPLVRPDAVLYSVAFLVVLLALSAPGWRRRIAALGWAILVPALFEVFRMAYFATVVPNTALAKEASQAAWASGLRYLGDFAGTYLLAIPVSFLFGWALLALTDPAVRDRRRWLLVLSAPVVAALVHATYVVRVGGDFMHGRLLLPATFALLLPVSAMPVLSDRARRPASLALASALGVWVVVCAGTLRLPYAATEIRDGIADERAFWNAASTVDHAVTLEDHADYIGVRRGVRARALAAEGADVLVRHDGTEVPLRPGSGVVLESTSIGLDSAAAGTDVYVYDLLGLADALGGRFSGFEGERRIGHEKHTDFAWVMARTRPIEPVAGVDAQRVAAAERALACADVRELEEATSGPLTVGRALTNIGASLRLTRLRVPADPLLASSCP